MPTPTKGPRLGGGPAHERLILANLATSLFEHDSITTTEAKAKRLRPLAERLITFAKRGDLHARRRVMTVVRDKGVVHRLFAEIAPDMAERQRRLHPHHQDRRPQGRQRPHGGHRARPRAASPRRPPSRRPRPPPSVRPRTAEAKRKAAARPGPPRRPADETKATEDEAKAESAEEATAVELPAGAVAATEDGSRPTRATRSRATPTPASTTRSRVPVVRPDDRRVLVQVRRGRRGRRLRPGRRRARQQHGRRRGPESHPTGVDGPLPCQEGAVVRPRVR